VIESWSSLSNSTSITNEPTIDHSTLILKMRVLSSGCNKIIVIGVGTQNTTFFAM
jgi:hypothetical protein